MSHALTLLTMCTTPECGRFGGVLDESTGRRLCGACALSRELEATALGS